MLLGLGTKVMSAGASLADKVSIISCCSYVLSDNTLCIEILVSESKACLWV